jgi:hypothetical protein
MHDHGGTDHATDAARAGTGRTDVAGRTCRTAAARVLRTVRRTYPLAIEMAILTDAVIIWQFARIPFEVSAVRAIDAARDWISLEQALRIDIEPAVIGWAHVHPDLLAAATWFYHNMDETIAFAVLAALRLIDPLRFPTVRTAFVLAHVPALAVVAGYAMAPPVWVPEMPFSVIPAAGFEGGLRNSTAAAVSLHVGVPVLLAVAAIWMRPRSPFAWLVALYPAVVFAVVLATGKHFVLDAVVGIACVAIGGAAARLIHGRVPRGQPEAGPTRIALTGLAFASFAYLANAVVLGVVS